VNEPQVNVDHFYHRPVYHAVGLLTENSEIRAISKDLESAGVDVTAVEILCGEQGKRILDEHGRYHGLRGRIVRAFQRLGYDETTLAIYDEALRKGDPLLQVPVPPAQRRRVVELLQHHHVHDVGHFAAGTFGQFPIRRRLTAVGAGPTTAPAACPIGGASTGSHRHLLSDLQDPAGQRDHPEL
jgi:hypothetical protein